MGRPKGSKNKAKSSVGLNGGEWLQRNIEKSDIKDMPKLEPIKIPVKKINKDDLIDMIRENGVAYMVELFPARLIEDTSISTQWKLCQKELIKLKDMIYDD